jgi:hypothetical protein
MVRMHFLLVDMMEGPEDIEVLSLCDYKSPTADTQVEGHTQSQGHSPDSWNVF